MKKLLRIIFTVLFFPSVVLIFIGIGYLILKAGGAL